MALLLLSSICSPFGLIVCDHLDPFVCHFALCTNQIACSSDDNREQRTTCNKVQQKVLKPGTGFLTMVHGGTKHLVAA